MMSNFISVTLKLQWKNILGVLLRIESPSKRSMKLKIMENFSKNSKRLSCIAQHLIGDEQQLN